MTTLDPRPALVVIDLQKALVGRLPLDDVVARSAELASAFRDSELPVVLVTATGTAPGRTERVRHTRPDPTPDGAEVVPELDARAGDIRVVKQTWGAFHGTSLDADLRERGVTQVVLTGVATSAGVESTARAAHEHGYNVLLVTDAMTDADPVAHTHSVERIFPKLGETATTADVLELLGTMGT